MKKKRKKKNEKEEEKKKGHWSEFVKKKERKKKKEEEEVGMALGQGGFKGRGFCPCHARFCLAPSLSHPRMTEKIFLPHPRPLGPRPTS